MKKLSLLFLTSLALLSCNDVEFDVETKEDCLQRLYMKAIDEQIFYSKKYYKALDINDFETMQKYADSAKISYAKSRFIYNEMYPINQLNK